MGTEDRTTDGYSEVFPEFDGVSPANRGRPFGKEHFLPATSVHS